MEIASGRIDNPASISADGIAQACAQHGELTLQFSRADAYDPAKLAALNEACRLAGEALCVRFYGHYGDQFDAAWLRHLPEVRTLSVDCLTQIVHEEEIGRLPRLTRLSFGVFELNRPDLLETLDLARLKGLTLVENRKRNVDLSPLARATSLTQLFIHGHSKGIGAIASLPDLRRLTLSAYAKSNGLGFIADLPQLEALTLILGGRATIDDLSSQTLGMLQILRLRGLATLGDLSRFPALTALRVEDQLQLLQLDLNGAQLERLSLFNCRKLAALPGLESQQRLREFSVFGTMLDLDALRDRDWPATARSIRLNGASKAWNEDARQRLAAKGLNEQQELWP
ncbi:leucine-rich repeat domain-containing protein [Novosphingobium terrae]|uniref:hypothetical protein n=1 Tax=Novosphingobium terrae TaxID=2726189 RepID=UPI00197D7A26|nr:hypothetical protein [Novosphingobium terrae]